MADLIDRYEIMKDLRSECPESDACLNYSPCIECIVNRQPAINRWISCVEQLPERETDVLVYIPVWEDNPIQVAYLMYDGITWELSDGEFNFGKREVLYWMPMPEPPEGGTGNG